MDRSNIPASQLLARLGGALGLVVLMGALVLGCGRGSFVGRQYDDFTAYYNTYHNAEAAFEKGLESVTQSEGEVDRARYISVFPAPQTGSRGNEFEKAIQKSADLLRKHPNSKWVDDALMLIGRSRHYQQNYVGAAQKFREVIALGGEREGEARFRLARTLIAADRYAEAADVLRVGLEQTTDSGTWTDRMWLVRGELAVRQQRWAAAETDLERGLKGDLPETAGSRAAFLLGQVRETLDNPEGAQAAYRQVQSYDPRYQLEFAARLGALDMQGRQGEPDRALDRLGDLERADNTAAMRGRIARVRARLYQEQGRPERARQVLTGVLRSEDPPGGAMEGRIHYDLATLYRDTYEDFTNAAAHFDTAATALPSGGGSGQASAGQQSVLLPDAPSDAVAQAERFRDIADRSRAVARMDSLLHLGEMPPSEFQSTIEQIRQRRLDAQEREADRERQRQFRRTTREASDGARGGQPQPNAVETRQSDAGFLFHRDPTLVQQGRRQFRQTWGSRPLVDNWRRVNAVQGSGEESTTADDETVPTDPQRGGRGGGEVIVDVSAVPRDSTSQAQMKKKRVVAQYELANALYRAAGRPDSAETWFRRILDTQDDHPVARKALYGLAQTHRAQGDSAAARDAYRRLVEQHPNTPYARRAKQQLGVAPTAPKTDRVERRADSVYTRAYDTWQGGAPRPALDRFLRVAKTYPETAAAPRALLAAGVIYHRTVQHDTSGGTRNRFRQFVDSLAQAGSGPRSGAESRRGVAGGDTTGASPPDTVRQSAHTPDSTAERAVPDPGRTSPRRGGQEERASSPPDTIAGPPVKQASLDSTSRAERASEPAQVEDSTATPVNGRFPSRSTPVDTAASASRRMARSAPTADSIRADSARTPRPDTTQGRSARVGATLQQTTPPLEVLFAHLTEKYADAPAAERAEALLAYLRQQRAAVDSAAADTSRSRAPSNTTPDTTVAASIPSDSVATPRPSPQDSAAASDSSARPSMRSPDSVRPDRARSQKKARRNRLHTRADTLEADSTTVPRDSAPAPSPDSSGNE